MGLAEWIALAALVISLLGSLIGYLMADARNKANLENLKKEAEEAKKISSECTHKVAELEIALAKSQADRENLWRQVEKLDAGKVSKDVFDGLSGTLQVLRTDFDKRFDRVERLIETMKS